MTRWISIPLKTTAFILVGVICFIIGANGGFNRK